MVEKKKGSANLFKSKFSLTKNQITHGLWNYLQNLMQNNNNYGLSNFAYIISNI